MNLFHKLSITLGLTVLLPFIILHYAILDIADTLKDAWLTYREIWED